jgi:hypothetical protein
MNENDLRFYDIGWDFAAFRRRPPDTANKLFLDG